MSIWLSLFISDFINNMTMGSFFLKEYKNKNGKINFNIIAKLLLVAIVITLITTLILTNTTKMIKTILKILVSGFLFRFVFKDNMSKNTIKVFLIYIVVVIYDILFGLMYIGIFHFSMEQFNNSPHYILIGNIIIALLTFITIQIKKVNDAFIKICEWYNGKNTTNLIVNITLCVISLWFFINKNASGNTSLYEYVINFGIISVIIAFVIGFFKENSDKNYIKKEYDQLLNYAKTYEQEIVEKSKWQHEYQNQLVLVRDKIKEQSAEQAISYIDELLKNKPTDENTEWLKKLSQFPDVGIKGLLHYKICQMKELNISVYVDVINDASIKKTSKINKFLEEHLQDISRVLGVYLDNAIQAASKSDKKYIIFEFKSSKNQIVFEISNTYKGKIDIEKIGKENYTTKGTGHGYGLLLTKDILSKNKYLKQNTEINGIYFVQKLIVDIKK